MTPPQTQALRGSNLIRPAAAAVPASVKAATRPAFYLTAIFVFVVYARLPEIVDMLTGIGVHAVRILMVLGLLATLLFGGDLRAVLSKTGICLMVFTFWMCICTPFSIWRGGSLAMLRDVWSIALFSFVIVAAAVQGFEQCRKIMYILAAATAFMEGYTLIMGRVQAGRMGLVGGTLGNANYLALMLLMGAPFCLYVLRTKSGLSALKFACLLTLVCIPLTVAGTGSRGGLVTLAIMFVMYFVPLPVGQKLGAAVGVLVLAVVAITLSSRSALDRYRAIFPSSDQAQLTESERSAIDSSELRKQLLRSSWQLTLQHPLLGVGPGMFEVANAEYIEATTSHSAENAWHETHNTFTQLSCEDGLPGLILYCLALLLCFKIVYVVEKRARRDPALSSVGHIAFALRLALVAFTGTAIFASNAYMYYFPMLAGLCVALDRATAAEFSSQAPQDFGAIPVRKPGGNKAMAWQRPPVR
jgi:O-antigen ligase